MKALAVSLIAGALISLGRAEQIELTKGSSRCVIETLGARVLSYSVAGQELLWMPKDGLGDDPVWRHGGIPLAWPWFGRIGRSDENIHGYAWKKPFSVKILKTDAVVLVLETEMAALEYEISLAPALTLRLRTTNRSRHDLPLGQAFHPYFRVGERDETVVEGLGAGSFPVTNAVDRGFRFAQEEAFHVCRLHDVRTKRILRIESSGLTGVNVWNPGAKKDCPGAISGDEWRRFVAVEPYATGINRFMVLNPGGTHQFSMTVNLEDAGSSCAESKPGRVKPSAGVADLWAVTEGGGATGSGLYMVSGDVKPDGADAWFDPQSGSLTRSDGTVIRDYVTATYGVPYRPINPNLIFKTPPVGWMTWYAVKFGASDEIVLRNAKAFKEKFCGYTDEQPVLWVDWEWFHGRFEEDGVGNDTDMLTPRKDAYPRGMKPLADDLRALGFTPALWVSVFSDVRTNRMWRANPEWILGEEMKWCGAICANPCVAGFCESFVPELFALYKSWGYEAYKWDTIPVAYGRFERFRAKGRPVDPPRESLRKCAAAVRRAVGEDCYIMSCSGENDEANLAAMDIFDGGRIGGDIFSWEDFRKWGVDRILSYQPFHNTVFWSDADNLVLRPEFSTEAQARTRVSIYALAGLPITVGDEISALDDRRVDMLRRAMPVVKMRPASLTRGAPAPDLLPLRADFRRSCGTWTVRGWSNLTTNKCLSANFAVENAVVWDFWGDRLVDVVDDMKNLSVAVEPGDTVLYRITPVSRHIPTLVSVSRHVTQGGYEIKEYAADECGVRGVVRCPGGETVKVTFLLPEGTEIGSCSHGCDIDGRIVRVKLVSGERRDVAFHLKLKQAKVIEIQ